MIIIFLTLQIQVQMPQGGGGRLGFPSVAFSGRKAIANRARKQGHPLPRGPGRVLSESAPKVQREAASCTLISRTGPSWPSGPPQCTSRSGVLRLQPWRMPVRGEKGHSSCGHRSSCPGKPLPASPSQARSSYQHGCIYKDGGDGSSFLSLANQRTFWQLAGKGSSQP